MLEDIVIAAHKVGRMYCWKTPLTAVLVVVGLWPLVGLWTWHFHAPSLFRSAMAGWGLVAVLALSWFLVVLRENWVGRNREPDLQHVARHSSRRSGD
jgi:hypothetical protein